MSTTDISTECVLGAVTEKAKAHMKREAEATAKEKAESSKSNKDVVLQMHKSATDIYPRH